MSDLNVLTIALAIILPVCAVVFANGAGRRRFSSPHAERRVAGGLWLSKRHASPSSPWLIQVLKNRSVEIRMKVS